MEGDPMKLSVNIIYENLPYSKRYLWDTEGENRSIEDILFLSGDSAPFTAAHLYVGPSSLLPPLDTIPDHTNFLCYGQPPVSLQERLPFNLIVIEEEVPVWALFNLLQTILARYNRWEQALEAAVQSGAPLQEFIDFSTDIIGWPLAMIDIAQGTLAISDFDDSDDLIWNDQKNGYIRTELCTRDSIQNENIEAVSGPVQMYSSVSDRVLLAQAIRIRSHTVGFVSAHRPRAGTERFPRSVEQLIDYLTAAVSRRMSSSEFYQYSRGFILDCLIVDLIDRKITDVDVIRDRLEFAKWEGGRESRVSVVRLGRETPEKAGLQSLLEQLESLLPRAKALYYQGSVIVLQQLPQSESAVEKADQRYIQWLQSHEATCGISNTFSDYSRLADYYVQARKALFFGGVLRPEDTVHRYRDYIQAHMYETLAKTTDLRLFIHPDVQRLMQHCKTKEYIYETVLYLIKNDFNIINTSREMFIHKNTLSYRLHQIEDLAGFSFSDPSAKAVLTGSFQILNYMVTFLHYNISTDTYEGGADGPSGPERMEKIRTV